MRATYPGRGQNHRGAGRRFSASQTKLTRALWGPWLERVMAEDSVSPAELLRTLADQPEDRDSHPRAQVRGWLAGRQTVSPTSAFRVGEALRACGLSWCSGPLALYASRHYGAFLSAIRFLSHEDSPHAREFACGMLVYAQIIVEYDLHAGFEFAVQTLAPRFMALQPQAERDKDLLLALPAEVSRIRKAVTHATTKMADYLSRAARYVDLTALHARSESLAIDRAFMEPSLSLLASKAPPDVAWDACQELLAYWAQDALTVFLEREPTTLDLWGEQRVVGQFEDGRIVGGSIVHEHRELLRTIRLARSMEPYTNSVLARGRPCGT